MSREDNRRCLTGRKYARDVLDRKREVGRLAQTFRRAVDGAWPTVGRYRAELETAKAKRLNSMATLAEHDLACDVCGRNVS